jgi:hypothetical protein
MRVEDSARRLKRHSGASIVLDDTSTGDEEGSLTSESQRTEVDVETKLLDSTNEKREACSGLLTVTRM